MGRATARVGARWFEGRWALWLGVGLVASVVYLALPPSLVSQFVLYDGVVLLAVLACLSGYRRGAPDRRRPWLWTTLALAGFLAGEVLWWVYSLVGIDPYPSLADAVFLLSYVPLALAAAALARQSEADADRSAWIDAGILALTGGLVVWKVLMAPYATDSSLSGLYRAVTLAYPLADILVLGFVLRLVFLRSARTRAGSLVVLGLVLTLLGDLGFAWLDLQGVYADGMWIDGVWLAGYLAIGAAAVVVQPAPAEAVAPAAGDLGLGRGRLAIVLAAVAVPLVLLLIELGPVGFDTATLAVGVTGVVTLLVAFRLWGLLGRARRLEQRRSQNRLSEVIHHSSDAIVLVDSASRITYASPAFGRLTSQEPDACVGSGLTEWVPAGERTGLSGHLRNAATMPPGSVLPIEVTMHGDGDGDGDGLAVCEGTVVNLLLDADVAALVVTLRDVTARRQMEGQLQRQAFHDELTGLANRTLFLDRLNHALERFERHPAAGVAVLFVDLDEFKAVNDGMGHAAGDELLTHVAERLRLCLRPGDTVARLGGDEFAVLLEDLPSESLAEELAGRLLDVLALPVSILDLDLAVPASVGVAFAQPGVTAEGMMRDADIAMYRAKALGKARVVIFDNSLRDDATELLTLKVELPKALEAAQFRLVYQPIVELGGQAFVGFEALVRWDHPERGEVQPVDFIGIAERTGAIVDLGRWILNEACDQAAAWNESSPRDLVMSVNLSAVQLRNPGFLDDVRAALRVSGLPGRLLTLEITESILVDPVLVEPIFAALRSMDVGIAIDDFGTGYSSLSYLQHFPVTSVKIDQAFVADLSSRGDTGVVRSILALAETMSLMTVAEGVETAEQLEALEALDCGLAQGFFLGRPQTPEAVAALLDDGAPVSVALGTPSS